MKNRITSLIVLTFTIMLSACAAVTVNRNAAAPVYNANDAGKVNNIETGVVQSVRQVQIQNKTGYTGMIIGAGTGAALGNKIGKGNGRKLNTIVGAAAGAAVGDALAEAANQTPGIEIVVRTDAGRLVSVVQPSNTNENFAPGQRVRLTHGISTARVTSM